MRLGGVARLVQRVQQVRVMRAKAQLVDVVAEIEPSVVQVCLHPKLHVPVASGGDVEVALDLVALEGAVDATAVDLHLALQPGRAREFAPFVLAHVAQDVADVGILLLGLLPGAVAGVQAVVDVLLLFAQTHPFHGVGPDLKVGVFFRQQVAGHDAVHGRVLDVDVQVAARHGNNDVQVQLELMAHPTLDAEVMGFGAGPPGA